MHRQARAARHAWWVNRLKPGFRHVQLWRSEQYGPLPTDVFWTVVEPGLELVKIGTIYHPDPPWVKDSSLTVQIVTSEFPSERIRDIFFIGPVTCVEIAKAFLGIRSLFIRTPWQLFKHVHKNNNFLSR